MRRNRAHKHPHGRKVDTSVNAKLHITYTVTMIGSPTIKITQEYYEDYNTKLIQYTIFKSSHCFTNLVFENHF